MLLHSSEALQANSAGFLADCLGVGLLTRCIFQFAQLKATGLIVLVAVVAFRCLNRVCTYRVIRHSFSPKTVAWNKMVQRLDDAENALHKPFARPVVARTFGKQPYGVDVVASAVVSLRVAYAHPGFKNADALLAGKIKTPEQFGVVMCHLDSVQKGLRRFCGIYRRKIWLDVFVAAKLTAPSASSCYSVIANSGIASSLCYLYDVQISNEQVLSSLFNRLYWQLRSCKGANRNRSL